ncbi:hypothetical protein LTR53_017557 [Teratosphaeriaceae sp. CCFEE 6253]|nr:hypothetical protein LTR53_017557 [Teratosphaeriaceae sp. CCFEE 6253]
MQSPIITPLTWLLNVYHKTSLDLAGLIFLAPIDAIARQTAYTGGRSWLGDAEALVLCPGLHSQQDAPLLSKGEYPACAAMTTGYVFRVENEATVLYLQRVGRTGYLTTLRVAEEKDAASSTQDYGKTRSAYKILPFLTIAILASLCWLADWPAIIALCLLALVRRNNLVLLRRRLANPWHGQSEPGVQGDLLVLLSQDRWVRTRGAVDDLKAVTSGKWLRDLSPGETSAVSTSALVVYLAVIMMGSASKAGQVLLLALGLVSAVMVMAANQSMQGLEMNGRVLKVVGEPKAYARRLDLAEELITETGRKDWALRMGMVQPGKGEEGPVSM